VSRGCTAGRRGKDTLYCGIDLHARASRPMDVRSYDSPEQVTKELQEARRQHRLIPRPCHRPPSLPALNKDESVRNQGRIQQTGSAKFSTAQTAGKGLPCSPIQKLALRPLPIPFQKQNKQRDEQDHREVRYADERNGCRRKKPSPYRPVYAQDMNVDVAAGTAAGHTAVSIVPTGEHARLPVVMKTSALERKMLSLSKVIGQEAYCDSKPYSFSNA
jgi:hypothetical protein